MTAEALDADAAAKWMRAGVVTCAEALDVAATGDNSKSTGCDVGFLVTQPAYPARRRDPGLRCASPRCRRDYPMNKGAQRPPCRSLRVPRQCSTSWVSRGVGDCWWRLRTRRRVSTLPGASPWNRRRARHNPSSPRRASPPRDLAIAFGAEQPPSPAIGAIEESPKRSRLNDQPDRRMHSSVRQLTLLLLRLRFRRPMLRCPRITAAAFAVTPIARVCGLSYRVSIVS
jgi:hypothetical protein